MKIFPESKDLKGIIEGHNWTLYDVSNPPEGRAYTWEEIEKMTRPTEYQVEHQYLFVPIPKNGQTLREAYSPTKGLGPSLKIDSINDDRWVALTVSEKTNGNVALFTRLFMHKECAFLSSPETIYLPNPDFVGIKYDKLIDTFKRYFRIVSPKEYGLKTPIPMPQVH